MQRVGFLDLENVSLNKVDYERYAELYIFIGASQKELSFEGLDRTIPIHFIQVEYVGPDSLDRVLCAYFGAANQTYSKEFEFVIISGDKGFDGLIHFFRNHGRRCNRVGPSPRTRNRIELDRFSQLRGRIFSRPKHLRPKTVKALRNYLRNGVANCTEGFIDRFIKYMTDGSHIQIVTTKNKGLRITYFGDY